ncbi:hypothetical protein RHMOL_Rhmol05G0295700 [Rhododendron molle]|uniref:Uncharacterized protein n=1 Tax=Rhododendron molle TaxID=49168 RepID=A0ACC0NVZ8_RHOML|nr:hypothetical protein RHMOL_Rhmol05G0295700 [Rhododendron molle]
MILHFKRQVPQRDPIFGNSLTFYKVQNDLVLLENQIPFFVLEKLFQLTVGVIPNHSNENWSLTDYVRNCYKFWMAPRRNSDNDSAKSAWCSPSDGVLRVLGSTAAAAEEEVVVVQSAAKYYHILHNLHDGYIPSLDQTNLETPGEIVVMPSASELAYAGVKFVPDASGNTLFNIKFIEHTGLFWWCRGARFVIPPLVIEDSTESYLRNLIALEQCCPSISQHVSSYAWLMDILVNSDKDIQVLEKAGVLINYLGTSEASAILSKLCKECYIGSNFLNTAIRATEYSTLFWPKNLALLASTYFDSPWTFIAFCVGFIAFVISLVQFARDFGKKG